MRCRAWFHHAKKGSGVVKPRPAMLFVKPPDDFTFASPLGIVSIGSWVAACLALAQNSATRCLLSVRGIGCQYTMVDSIRGRRLTQSQSTGRSHSRAIHRACRARSTLSRYSLVVVSSSIGHVHISFALSCCFCPQEEMRGKGGGWGGFGRGRRKLLGPDRVPPAPPKSVLKVLGIHAGTCSSPSASGLTLPVLIRHRSTASCLASATTAFLRMAREPPSSTALQRLSRQ